MKIKTKPPRSRRSSLKLCTFERGKFKRAQTDLAGSRMCSLDKCPITNREIYTVFVQRAPERSSKNLNVAKNESFVHKRHQKHHVRNIDFAWRNLLCSYLTNASYVHKRPEKRMDSKYKNLGFGERGRGSNAAQF